MTKHTIDIFYAARVQFMDLVFTYVQTIETAKKALVAEKNPTEAMEVIAGVAHKISGVAGTLGYIETGELASLAEQKTRAEVASGRAAAGAASWTRIEPQIEALLNSLEALLDQHAQADKA
jgi:HPt (histidine-containing phosphotransfer) domain-containing protein